MVRCKVAFHAYRTLKALFISEWKNALALRAPKSPGLKTEVHDKVF